MNGFDFPKDFCLGVASAATQIEGNNKNNSWFDWYERGNIKDNTNPDEVNDHYVNYERDYEIMRSMGITAYRFGIEWARIEPEDNAFDDCALNHYRDEIKLMRSYGIKPMLTLHHFTNPMWFEKMGGFERDESVEIFLRFVRKIILSLGDLVDEYITINEPNVYTVNGYFFASWPPGKKSFACVRKVYKNMALCHIKSYTMIHELRSSMGFGGTMVSFANHLRVFETEKQHNLFHRICANFMKNCFQSSLTSAFLSAESYFPVPKLNIPKGLYCDFIAVNYYTRSTVSGFADGVKKSAPVNDLGWEIYPEGIVKVIKDNYRNVDLPIYITENGTCDNNDTFRARYIYEHLKTLCLSGLNVKRYYHWCFTDNFEWLEGVSARFGLVYMDYSSNERAVKQSGKFYCEMIANNGVTEEMYDKYIKDQKYNYNE